MEWDSLYTTHLSLSPDQRLFFPRTLNIAYVKMKNYLNISLKIIFQRASVFQYKQEINLLRGWYILNY